MFIRNCAIEMGWQTTIDGVTDAPSLRDVSWTFVDARHIWDAFGLTNKSGERRNRRVALTDLGRAAALSYLRHIAAGPKDSPW